jgi:hypothetical protein
MIKGLTKQVAFHRHAEHDVKDVHDQGWDSPDPPKWCICGFICLPPWFHKVGCETATKDNMVMVAGEITTQANIDYDKVVRGVVERIGFDSYEEELCSATQPTTGILHSFDAFNRDTPWKEGDGSSQERALVVASSWWDDPGEDATAPSIDSIDKLMLEEVMKKTLEEIKLKNGNPLWRCMATIRNKIEQDGTTAGEASVHRHMHEIGRLTEYMIKVCPITFNVPAMHAIQAMQSSSGSCGRDLAEYMNKLWPITFNVPAMYAIQAMFHRRELQKRPRRIHEQVLPTITPSPPLPSITWRMYTIRFLPTITRSPPQPSLTWRRNTIKA